MDYEETDPFSEVRDWLIRLGLLVIGAALGAVVVGRLVVIAAGMTTPVVGLCFVTLPFVVALVLERGKSVLCWLVFGILAGLVAYSAFLFWWINRWEASFR